MLACVQGLLHNLQGSAQNENMGPFLKKEKILKNLRQQQQELKPSVRFF